MLCRNRISGRCHTSGTLLCHKLFAQVASHARLTVAYFAWFTYLAHVRFACLAWVIGFACLAWVIASLTTLAHVRFACIAIALFAQWIALIAR